MKVFGRSALKSEIQTARSADLAELERLRDADRDNRRASIAESTRKAYRGDLRRFCTWCEKRQLASLPATATTVCLYLAHLQLAGRKPSTIRKALSAISAAHRAAGHPAPSEDARVRAAVRGIRRKAALRAQDAGATLVDRAAALTAEQLAAMVQALPDHVRGHRDRALILLGATGAFRRSELAALRVDDVTFTTDGLRVVVRRSKTDQEGAGRILGIVAQHAADVCPLRALRRYLDEADIRSGYLFRSITNGLAVTDAPISHSGVNRAVKRAAKLAGLQLAGERISAHSLRATAATLAIRRGKRPDAVQRLGGWSSLASMSPYVREGRLFDADNPTANLLEFQSPDVVDERQAGNASVVKQEALSQDTSPESS